MRYRPNPTRRRGTVAPLLAILLIPLLGMMAFSVDLGYMIVVRTELQNAADAAAMAGAQQLMQPYAEYYSPGNTALQSTVYGNAVSMAKATAKAVAANNTAGGVKINVQDGTPNYDVTVGYYDGTTFTSAGTWSFGASFPNSVRVLVRRDNTGDKTSANGAVKMFFGPVFGVQSTNQQAYAQASTYTISSVTGFQNVSNLNVGMIPATFDVATWKDFIDNGVINSLGQQSQAATALDVAGDNALQIYGSVKGSGNFGSLPIDAQHTGSLASQIVSGMTQSLYQTLADHNTDTSTPLVPLAPWDMSTLAPVNNTVPSGDHDPGIAPSDPKNPPGGSWNWQGDPGFRSTDASTLNNYPGIYLLPLYKAYDDGSTSGSYQPAVGNGQAYYYNIVDFVPVQITTVVGESTNKEVWVKPAAMVLDLNQIVGGSTQLASPPSSWSAFTSLFVAPRLTQ
jgi:Flp pilus assembly protein TadG